MAVERYDGAFAAALLEPGTAPPAPLARPAGAAIDRRFAVYRNNVAVSLVNALAEIFPAVQSVVGERFFRAMARAYMAEEPPVSKLVFRYGAGFPAFLERFGPAARMPYLPDLARLERAWLDAYHAADRTPLGPEALAAVEPEALAGLTFRMHPAFRLIRSEYAVFTIFEANRGAAAQRRILAATPEAAMVTRPALAVTVTPLERGAAGFAVALDAGGTLAEATEAAFEADPGFDLSKALTTLIEAGALAATEREGRTTWAS